MTERTYLTTAFREKDKVKALGARWDREAGQWFVPTGLDLAPFAAWLPEAVDGPGPGSSGEAGDASAARELTTQVKGVPLSRLLGGVAAAVAQAFGEGVWTTAEVVRASPSKGHWYLELSERNEAGEVLAQARAVIWARHARGLLTEFKRATGADLDAGIKVLVRARPTFNASFGFSLEVDAIDPSYTLGDLEAKKRDIRERLKREGLLDLNRQLPAPWDYAAVLVVAPERAAGLGDFAADAQLLERHGVCQFSYAYSRFQGEGAAAEIARALQAGLRTWSAARLPDAVAVIRGGGSVNDLAWLNDYALARCICECPVPVLTGIGHERDSTILDEVAHRRFDTPSKVIAGLRDVIRTRTTEARRFNESILGRVQADLVAASSGSRQAREHVEAAARTTILRARSGSEAEWSAVRWGAAGSLHAASRETRQLFDHIRSDARTALATARQTVPALLGQIRSMTESNLRHMHQRIDMQMPYVVARAADHARAARGAADGTLAETFEVAARSLQTAADRSQALFREIAGQGPRKTLRRGFAVVRSTAGKAITSAADITGGTNIEVQLHDGVIGAQAQTVNASRGDEMETRPAGPNDMENPR